MAVPFFEPKENDQNNKQQHGDEGDQVDGHIPSPIVNSVNQQNHSNIGNINGFSQAVSENELTAWKMLAMAMCKALKDHYIQNISSSANTSAVVHILPNGDIKPSWN